MKGPQQPLRAESRPAPGGLRFSHENPSSLPPPPSCIFLLTQPLDFDPLDLVRPSILYV